MTLTPNNPIQLGQYLARLGRPQNIVYSGLLGVITGWIMGNLGLGLKIYVLLWLAYNLAAGYNNLHDIAIDQLNKNSHNPLVTQPFDRRLLYGWLSLNLALLSVSQIWLPQPTSILLTVLMVILLFGYSNPHLNIQARGYGATLLLGFFYGSLPLLLVGLPLHINWIYILAGIQVPLLGASLLAKDYKDEVGDRAGGKRTPLIRYGARKILLVARLGWLFGSLGILSLLIAASTTGLNIVVCVVILLLGYGLAVNFLHQRHGKVPRYFLRLPQAALLLLNGLIAWALH